VPPCALGGKEDAVSNWTRRTLIAGIVGLVAGLPTVYFRAVYDRDKRLRILDPGRVYRSGQMTAEGFADAVESLHIRTVVNLQDDFPDPDIDESFLSPRKEKESELCRRLGVRYVCIKPDLVPLTTVPDQRPAAIEEFLRLCDDPSTYPMLIHCRAGLNRTGCFAALYRMEYQGWTTAEAFAEMIDLGFGTSTCTSSNAYVNQYVLTYRRGKRQPVPPGVAPRD
jgi:hypothetical protein